MYRQSNGFNQGNEFHQYDEFNQFDDFRQGKILFEVNYSHLDDEFHQSY